MITVFKEAQRAIIRTSHTWFYVGIDWLRANHAHNPLFAEALRRLES